jgi:uncharacterized protein YbaP (TraB family)
MRVVNFVPLLFVLFSCTAQKNTKKLPVNKDENTLLWQISGNGLKEPSYLFGTFHLLCKTDIHFSESLKEAVKSAKEVYMEMDMDDPATLLGGLTKMNMKGGKKLKDLYTEEEYKRLAKYFTDSVGMPLAMLQSMKPLMLESLLYPQLMPCKTISGVEEELMQLIKKEKKEIKGLETIEFQSSVFDSIPYDKQAKELLKTIDSINEYRKYFDTILTVYKKQQMKSIEQLLTKDDFGMEENQDILLNNRNKNWVNQLKEIMHKENVFVAVGAGHLPGKLGVINLLKNEGYTVTPIFNK